LQGQTNINQTAFILENSKLHIGNDSFAIHMCSAFDVPLIGLYSVSSPEIAGPFWKNKNQICLTPKNWKPSFNPNESPKRVNEIKIESIIESIQTTFKYKFKSKYSNNFYWSKGTDIFY
jgi:ADP-heptose:LPS heptosyltransferase